MNHPTPHPMRENQELSPFTLGTLGGCALLALVLLLATTGCRQLPKRQGSTVELLVDGQALEQRNPVDIVVAPVVDANADANVVGKAPLEALRKAFHSALVRRRYSPLALEYVDRQVVEATYVPGSLDEEAVLNVVVHQWDERLWDSYGAVFLDLEAHMVESGGEVLWAGRIQRRFEVGNDGVGSSAEKRRVNACKEIAREMLAAMPARRTGP